MNFNEAPKKYYDKVSGSLLTASQALANTRVRLVPMADDWIATEVMCCDRKLFNKGYGLLDKAPTRRVRDPDDLDDPETSLARSRRRALKAVRDIMDCNDFDWFMTFTLDPEKVADRTNVQEFTKSINRYFDNRVRRRGWKYCAVMEYHKRVEDNGKHALHLHACVSGDDVRLSDSGVQVKRSNGDVVPIYNVDDWALGFSTAIPTYGNRLALSRYLTKYITKSDDKIGGRWYYSGGALARPLYLYYDTEFNDFAADVEFSKDFADFKVKYFDFGEKIGSLDDLCEQ